MSNLVEPFSPQGMLHKGWTSKVLDYAIVCDWANKGNSLIVGDASGGLFAFEGFSGRTIWKNENIHNGGLLAMSISPDGNVIATSGQDGNVCFWDSNDGAEINILDLGKGWIEHLEWSPNGDFLAVAFSRNVLIFNPKGEEVWQSEDHSSTVSAIRWSKINEIATACYGKVTFFDCINNKINQQLQWQGSLVSMELSPNGDIVACGSQDNSVHFWRRSTGVDAEMTGYPGKPSSLSFDHTGTLLATGGSERVTVWSFHGNGPEGTRPGELGHHTQPISTLSFSNNGTLLASGSRDGSVVISFLKNNGDGDPVGAAFSGNSVSSISWKPDDCALAAVNSEGIVNLWNFRVRSDLKYKGFD
tara:strand:+ start:1855 stop:2931 length:1077 start_codon:yes stop_codon:yes gene_type:complete